MIFDLFKKKKKTEVIHIHDVDAWIKKTFESKNLGLKVGILKRELNSKKAKTRELLNELEDTAIQDASVIPERAKNMYEGNKKAYIQKIEVFLETLDCPDEISQIETFLEDSSLKLEELAQDTNKNYFIIKEFSEDEARKVASKLKEIDNVISIARGAIEKTPISKFRELKELLHLYHSNLSSVDETKKLMEKVLEKKGLEIERMQKVESKIMLLKKSPHHDDYIELKNRKRVLEEELKKNEYTIINLFSGISSVLKKYDKQKKNKLAKSYSDDAVSGLLSDNKLGIIKVLEDVIKIKDSLDIKNSKAKKLDSEVQAVNKTNLENLKNNILKIKQDIKDLDNAIKNHSYALNLKELEGRINIIEENIKDIEREEQEVEDILERLNPRLIKQKMKHIIKSIDEGTDLI
jgi:hypothetical protein